MADESAGSTGRTDPVSGSGTNAAASAPVYQSKLRAKREERMQQQQQDQHQNQVESHPAPDRSGSARATVLPSTTTAAPSIAAVSARSSSRSTGAEEARRRQRAETRRLLIDYPGTVWDVVRANDLAMLCNFFLVEGAAKLVQAHSKSVDEFGRTLLHTAAWWGSLEAAQYLLSNGAAVNEIDTVATRLSPLMGSARTGNTEVALLMLKHGADATLRDASGDNVFHWAARHSHGSFLLQISLALDSLDHSALVGAWTAKNVRGRTPADYIRSHPSIFPMISKRLGARVPLHPPPPSSSSSHRHRPSVSGSTSSPSPKTPVDMDASLPTPLLTNGSPRPTTAPMEALSGVDALGLDVGSFVYKSRDSIHSH